MIIGAAAGAAFDPYLRAQRLCGQELAQSRGLVDGDFAPADIALPALFHLPGRGCWIRVEVCLRDLLEPCNVRYWGGSEFRETLFEIR